MSRERGILGLKKDPKHQLLFLFRVPKGEEWPSSDSEDDDYRPDEKHSDVQGSDDSDGFDSDGAPTKAARGKASSSRPSSRASSNNARLNSNNNSRTSQRQSPNKRKHVNSKSNSDTLSLAKKQKKNSAKAGSSGPSAAQSTGSDSEDNKDRNASAEKRFLSERGERRSSHSVGEGCRDVVTGSSMVPHLPPELWMRIFNCYVSSNGPLPFLCRASKVCRLWRELASHPTLWHKVDLSYGWIKSTDLTLHWLASNRLTQCREVSFAGWKNVTNNAVKELSEHCPHLESVNLSNCSKLTSAAVGALVDNCRSLRELDLSFISADGVSVQSLKKVAEQLGANLTSLNVAGNNLKGFHLALNAIMEHCPNLEMLDISNTKFSTDYLMLNVEKMHVGFPALRILRLANCKVRGSNVTQRAQEESPGFVKLTQLSCATPGSASPMTRGGAPDNLLQRLMHKAADLKLLDLRGCTSFNPDTLLASPALNLTQLYLSQSSITRYSDSLEPIVLKWGHSLKELDLAWTCPATHYLASTVVALTEFSDCPLEHVNLAGTTVTLPSIELILEKLSELTSLDLTSCRALPRGIKSLHQGKRALQKLRHAIKDA